MNPDILVSFTEAILRRTMFYKTFLQGYAHTRQVQKLRRSTIKVVFPMYYGCIRFLRNSVRNRVARSMSSTYVRTPYKYSTLVLVQYIVL